jgi:hypothetical protein
MAKEAYYFSHDSNARNDDKVITLRMKFGMEGYGVYFAILERMRDIEDYIHVKDYNVIAFDLRVSNTLVKSVVEDFGLFEFTEDDKRFYSVSFLSRMKRKDIITEKRREAGKKGGAPENNQHANKNKQKTSKNKQMLSKCLANDKQKQAIKGKENKEKEMKGNESDSLAREVDSDSEIFSISQLKNLSGEAWLETVGMKFHLSPENLNSFFDEFCDIQECSSYANTINDFRRHFVNWLNIKEKEKSCAKKEKDLDSDSDLGFEFSFENVWALYGRKGNRKTSERRWANLKNHSREAALKHIPLYVASTPDKQFRKNFETYLNQEAWNDEVVFKSNVNANSTANSRIFVGEQDYGEDTI